MSPPAEADVAINPRIRQRREQVERSRSQKRMRRLAAALAVAALVATGIYLLHTPLFGAKKVTITGLHPNTSDQDIRSTVFHQIPGTWYQLAPATPFGISRSFAIPLAIIPSGWMPASV